MCFSIIAGKQTTADGHVLIGANNDWPGYPGHIHHAPARSHPPGSRHRLVGGMEIPQVARTFAYTCTTTAYETGHLTESWWGGVNENQVAVGMQGVYAFKSCETGPGLEADDLTILILERGKTARQSIRMLGELIAEYGFSVSSIEGAAGCANIAIADPEEGFFFEIAPGGHWCAKRVEDDEAEVRPNCFGIQTVDFDDPILFMWSEHLVRHAVEQGWYDPAAGKPFNFHAVYSNNDPICVYGKADDPVNAHRRWRALNIISGTDPDPDVPQYSTRANRPLGSATSAI